MNIEATYNELFQKIYSRKFKYKIPIGLHEILKCIKISNKHQLENLIIMYTVAYSFKPRVIVNLHEVLNFRGKRLGLIT